MDNNFVWFAILMVILGSLLSFILIPPQPPANLKAISVSSSEVILQWEGSQGNFSIYRSTDKENFSKIGETSSHEYSDKTVIPATTYYYMVRAKSFFVESANSNIVSVFVPEKTFAPILKIESTSMNSIKLSWTESSNASFFELYRATNPSGKFVKVEKFPATLNEFEDKNLQENTTYYYKLEAFIKGQKLFSKVVSSKTRYEIKGYVKDEKGNGIKNVNLFLFLNGENLKTTTNDEGFWSFKDVYGNVTIKASASRYSISPNEVPCDGPKTITFTATFIDNPPNTPLLLAPLNKQKIQDVKEVLLKWKDSDPDEDPLVYDIYFGKEKNPPLLLSNYTSTSYKLEKIDYASKYYWKVVAKDPFGKSSSSQIWSFTTGTYSLSGKVLYKGSGLKGVEIRFGDGTSVLTDQNGYWIKKGLSKIATVTPFMKGWSFKPSSLVLDQNSTNVNFSAAPVSKEIKWEVTIGPIYLSSAAIGKNGNIYIGSLDGNLYSVNNNGRILWNFPTNRWIRTSPAIGKDGTIYLASDNGNLYALNPDGKVKWSFSIGSYIISSPCVDKNGEIYLGAENGYLYAFTSKGMLDWVLKLGEKIQSSPSIERNGSIYVGSSDGYFYRITQDGKILWKRKLGNSIFSSPAIDKDGGIYVSTEDGKIYHITSEGTVLWSVNLKEHVYSSPAVSEDGTVYICTTNGTVYAVKNKSIKWTYKASGRIISTPLVGINGKIYFGTENGILYVLNSNGMLDWKLKLKGSIYSSPSISKDGSLYIATLNSKLYAIQTKCFGISDKPWPKFKLDASNSSSLH
ncbi:PQQ-binding-like beta-propeller repeat protein [Mesoaciditoga lauensis]|uniref:beta-alanine-activating enzyme beta-propeller domain-containing protein n=1 Tax=Mesoaciditoga lauensis TaxID=1495039 RepID=UPI00068FBC42|nr:PQQ-binding-like beta-propeller repeat protein [Mesoaciditoga lauensis]